ncbi:MAG: copper homeostasis protein CutC [Acholeplasma sp.]|nr:copper homeostasis protein CutC [Acholeplasma sp.]
MLLEVIATTLKEAQDIEKYGGDRIELVMGIKEGGLTPSIGLVKKVVNSVNIPVNVMVRPHAKSFFYDEEDFSVILEDIKAIKETKANGIVFGSLNKDTTINEEQLKKVIEIKGHLKLTFHRAIDQSSDVLKSLDVLKKYDVDTILTSGGFSNAIDGKEKIDKMVQQKDITILAGAGLTPDNVETMLKNSSLKEVHMGSGVKFERKNENEINGEEIKKVKDILKRHA